MIHMTVCRHRNLARRPFVCIRGRSSPIELPAPRPLQPRIWNNLDAFASDRTPLTSRGLIQPSIAGFAVSVVGLRLAGGRLRPLFEAATDHGRAAEHTTGEAPRGGTVRICCRDRWSRS